MFEYVFMDIDGVLNLSGSLKYFAVPDPGTYQGLVVRESISASGRVKKWVVPEEVLTWVRGLMNDPNVQFVWSTTHQQNADIFAETFELPVGKPWVPQPNGHLVTHVNGSSTKILSAIAWVDNPENDVPEDAKIVIIEDMIGPADPDLAESRGFHLVAPNTRIGLTDELMASVDNFLPSRH